MPKHREVPSLQSLSLKSIGPMVVHLMPHIMSEINFQQGSQNTDLTDLGLLKSLDHLRKLLSSHVPFHIYDEMAVDVLKAVKELIEKINMEVYVHFEVNPDYSPPPLLVNTKIAARNLAKVVLTPQLKNIEFFKWPQSMRFVFCNGIHNLTGLENLHLGWFYTRQDAPETLWPENCPHYNFGLDESFGLDRRLLDSIARMKNLRSLCHYYGNTYLVQTVVENCPQIQCLDLTGSVSVTDRSIPHLLKCQNLKTLLLYNTSVSTLGFAQLIAGLPKLHDIGRSGEFFGSVIRSLHQNYSNCGPFSLRKIKLEHISIRKLQLFVEMFPKVEHISFSTRGGVSDLTVLIPLDHLNDLALKSFAFYANHMKQLLEVRGKNITSLHLSHVNEIDLYALVDLSQSCPKLMDLKITCCGFTQGPRLSHGMLKGHIFSHLEKISWEVMELTNQHHYSQHLEFMLKHAINIRHIHLPFWTDIAHSSIVNILTVNPMRQLEEFRVDFSSKMSMRTVELLLASCLNIKVLSQLRSWQRISEEELQSFNEYIRVNNFDLTTTHRLIH